MKVTIKFLAPSTAVNTTYNLTAEIMTVTQGYAKASVEASKIIESALATDTASGAVASFSDGADGLNLKSLVLGIEPVLSGSGDPSPSNVRPISGHTDVVVTRTGKNMLPSLADTKTVNSITFTHNADGTYKVNGTASANTTFYFTNQNAQAVNYPLKSAAYKVSGCPSGGSSSTYRMITYLYKGDTYTGTAVSDTGSGGDITVAEFDGARTAIDIKSGTTVSNLVFSPMIRISTDDATYEPYQSDTLSLPLPSSAGTVYGGTLDVTSGKLTVNRAMITLDGSDDESWTFYSVTQGNLFRSTNNPSPRIGNANLSLFLCSEYMPVINRANGTLSSSTAGYLDFVNNDIPNVNAWKAKLGENPVQVVFPLDTPIEYTLTPAQLKTLKGSNNVWQDSGTISVEYFCDTKLYVNKMIAAALNS